jgi:hypothetical protein
VDCGPVSHEDWRFDLDEDRVQVRVAAADVDASMKLPVRLKRQFL